MAKLTKAQRTVQDHDSQISKLRSRANDDSKAQAKVVADMYRDGKFRNWLTARDLLKRFAGDSRRSRLFARKQVDAKKEDWGRYRVKNERLIDQAKKREKVAINKIGPLVKRAQFDNKGLWIGWKGERNPIRPYIIISFTLS